MEALLADGVTVLIPPDANKRAGIRPGWDAHAFMRRVLATDAGDELYAKRQTMVEPDLRRHQISTVASTASCAGRAAAARSEWRLTNAAHNLLKLYRHTNPPTTA
jgi:hypothetical protein